VLTLLCFALACGLSWALGAHDARERERRRLAAGQIQRFEADLLRSRGIHPHPTPETAARTLRIRITRR
jgi:hypothetical protein